MEESLGNPRQDKQNQDKQSKTKKGVARDQSGDGLGYPKPVITCRHRAREDSVKNLTRNEGSGRFSPSRVGTDSIFLGETRLGSWARKARDTRSTQSFTSTTWPPPVVGTPTSERTWVRVGEKVDHSTSRGGERHRVPSRTLLWVSAASSPYLYNTFVLWWW